MARRREPEPPPEPAGTPPERLRRCWVEDWVAEDEQPPPWHDGEPWHEWARIAAWRRFSDARSAWGREHGTTLPSTGAPRFRDPPAVNGS